MQPHYPVKCKKKQKLRNSDIFNTVLFHQTNTLKCTNVAFAVKLSINKVVLLHEHRLRDVYTTRLLRY